MPKHLSIVYLFATLLILSSISFSFKTYPGREPKGAIEGYVFPNEAKPFVKIVLPNPKKATDTIHREIHANAAGYYKIQNLEAGNYTLVYFAKEKGYKRASQTVTVVTDGLIKAGEVMLEKR